MARQQSARNTMGFSSLSEWSVAHIESIFQATSHDQAMRAVDETFANDVEAYMNGTPIDVEGIKTQVLGLRRSSRGGLRVRWKNIVEAPNRPGSQAEGFVGGVYVIEGIHRVTPDRPLGSEYERHKVVTVKISSRNGEESGRDKRRIVGISFVAADIKLDRVVQAAL
ncbi:hypothetical protein FA13DRAFT_1789014 [Coprinellus micaceus]|uniref:Uncharacterized protein n=1 Tax=Coprinellus micaceus TaxID=71717 RepID=A0A4Y7TM23_COPMI|nr:hypothetical protein FA13DRAFT_1789014 [Coprinellus micaceus]